MSHPPFTPGVCDEMLRRGYAAYFRAQGGDQPSHALSAVEEHGSKYYVVLRSGRYGGTVVACYRVRNDGKLKRLVRLPAGVE